MKTEEETHSPALFAGSSVQLVQGEAGSEMWPLRYLLSEEEVKAKRAHKFKSTTSEQFLLVWTTAVAAPHTNFPQ